jgi:hypothetical protein
MKIPDHISESLETTLGIKVLRLTYTDPGYGILLTRDPGWTNSDPGSYIK